MLRLLLILYILLSQLSYSQVEGFNDYSKKNIDYEYSDRGNLLYDENKEISSIEYNQFDKPITIIFATGSSIKYVYNSNGKIIEAKYYKDANDNNPISESRINGISYLNNASSIQINLLKTSIGQIIPNQNKTYFSHYFIKDNLGSVRVEIDENKNIIKENQYYPFGLLMQAGSTNRQAELSPVEFNGKEFEQAFSLNLLNYGARNFDPAIARWIQIDPRTEIYNSWSGYNYTYNNPIRYIDPDGRSPEDAVCPLCWLGKASAGAAADYLMQVGFSHYFGGMNMDDAVASVDNNQVTRSFFEGLIPWKTPGGRFGRAALTGAGDVIVNAAKKGSDYTYQNAMNDFMMGALSDLAGGELGSLVNKYGGKAIAKGFFKFSGSVPDDVLDMIEKGMIEQSLKKTSRGLNFDVDTKDVQLHAFALGLNRENSPSFQKVIGKKIKEFVDNTNTIHAKILPSDLKGITNIHKMKEAGIDIYLDVFYNSKTNSAFIFENGKVIGSESFIDKGMRIDLIVNGKFD